MYIDPKLIGEWENEKGERTLLKSDATNHFGILNVPYYLLDFGQTLKIGKPNIESFYTRISGEPLTSIVGSWRIKDDTEVLTYETDGRYISVCKDDPPSYYGTYTVTPTTITSYEDRGSCTTDANNIIFEWRGRMGAGTYVVTDDTLIIVINDTSQIYKKIK